MPDHADFAAAITIRDQVLNDTFLNFYHAGQLSHSLSKTFDEDPFPRGSIQLFVQSPQVVFSDADPLSGILRLRGWGKIGIRAAQFPPLPERPDIQWQADLRIKPEALIIGKLIVIQAKAEDYQLASWHFDVLTGTALSAAANNYLNSGIFQLKVKKWLRNLVGDIAFPIDFGALGPVGGITFTNAAVRLVDGALVLGLNLDDGVNVTHGHPSQLHDFARDNQIAFVINSAVIPAMMRDAETLVRETVAQQDATLERLTITAEEGRFRVKGRASATGGAANFSLAVLPRMEAGRGGQKVETSKRTLTIRMRSWAALSFSPAEVSVDIDRSWWVKLIEDVGGVLTLGWVPLVVEGMISRIIGNITFGIETADVNSQAPLPLLRRIPSPIAGGLTTRVKIEQFEIHADGVFVGITSRLETKAPTVSGLESLPRNFANHTIRYDASLPVEALSDDPFLRVRWTVVNEETGSVLLNEDDVALNRLSFSFVPAGLGAITNRFVVICRIYRVLGPFATELLNETIRLHVGFPVEPGVYFRGPSVVLNPQIVYEDAFQAYRYLGDAWVQRHSKIHRHDKPCLSAKDPIQRQFSFESFDELPFPIRALNDHRHQLCDYCFFGGPASVRASL